MEHELRETLLTLADAYGAATEKTLPTIGKLALNDNTFFVRLKDEGSGFNVKTFDRLVGWFSENWPENAIWPEGIVRPAPAKVEA